MSVGGVSVSGPADLRAETVSVDLSGLEAKLDDLLDFQGLNDAQPLTLTPTQKTVNGKAVTVSGDGVTNATVTRTS